MSLDNKAPTLWGTVANLASKLPTGGSPASQAPSLGATERSMKLPMIHHLDSLEKGVEAKLAMTQTTLDKVLKDVDTEFPTFQDVIDSFLPKAEFSGFKKQLTSMLQGLAGRMSSLETTARTAPLFGGTTTSAFGGAAPTPKRSGSTVGSTGAGTPSGTDSALVLKKLGDMDRELSRLKAKSDQAAIKFLGVGVASFVECQAWVAKNFSSRAYGCLTDAHLLLERVKGVEPAPRHHVLTSLQKRDALGVKTEEDARTLALFQHSQPDIHDSGLAKGASAPGAHPSFLDRVATHAHWTNGTMGKKHYILNELPTVESNTLAEISRRIPDGTFESQVARDSLSLSLSFIRALMQFVDQTCESLVSLSKFSAKQAWSLASKLVFRIFEDLSKVRSGVFTSIKGTGPDAVCSQILWSILRAQDIMAEHSKHNFADHPSMSSECVKFLAANSGFEVITELAAQATSLKATAEKADKEAKSAQSMADKATKLAENTSKDLKDCVKQVKTLENKK